MSTHMRAEQQCFSEDDVHMFAAYFKFSLCSTLECVVESGHRVVPAAQPAQITEAFKSLGVSPLSN